MPDLKVGEGPESTIGIELIGDVNLNVKIELGRTRMLVDDVLRLSEGAVVELEKLAGDPVDIYVNDRPVARGEVLVLNDNFCVRVNEILENSAETIERLGA
ncbi:MAG: flagellar motor switch protein FliN [Planctomycetes bacterium]|nr:flagellar motor switch protein FliN [Planctomycetota bacterium]